MHIFACKEASFLHAKLTSKILHAPKKTKMSILPISVGSEYLQLILTSQINWNQYRPYTQNRPIVEDRVDHFYNRFKTEISRTGKQPICLSFNTTVFGDLMSPTTIHFIIDGQHRFEALKRIVLESPNLDFILTFRIHVHQLIEDATETMMKINDVIRWEDPFQGTQDDKNKVMISINFIRQQWKECVDNRSANPHRPTMTDAMMTTNLMSLVDLAHSGDQLIEIVRRLNQKLIGMSIEQLHLVGQRGRSLSEIQSTKNARKKMSDKNFGNPCLLGMIRHRTWRQVLQET